MQRKHWDTPRTLLQLATTCVFRSKYICSKMKCPTVLKLQPPYLDNTIIRDMVLSLSLIHLRMTDCTTNFHTRYLFLPHEHTVSLLCPCREKCVCTFDLGLLVVCIAPEAGNHYKHFVSRYTCHAMASSDSRQSKVLVMPPEPALIWERELAYDVIAVAAKVSAFAQPVHNIKAQMYTHHLGFFMVISMLFEGGGWLCW